MPASMRTYRLTPVVFAAFLAAAAPLAGCSQNTEQSSSEQPQGAQPAPPQPGEAGDQGAQAGQLPPGHPPVDGSAMPPQGQQIVPPAEGSGAGDTGMSWTAPANWSVEPPSSAMRRAQYRVPGPGGDGECVVFYFGPNEGGDVRGNVERWASQFPQADGSPAQPRTSEIKVGPIPVTMVEIRGTFAGGMGSAPTGGPKENYMLLGAVAKGPDANWFFKFIGPAQTVEAHRAAFQSMIKTLHTGA